MGQQSNLRRRWAEGGKLESGMCDSSDLVSLVVPSCGVYYYLP